MARAASKDLTFGSDMAFIALEQSQHRPYSAIKAALLAVACVIVLQPLFAALLLFARSHADLDAVKANVAAAYKQGVLDIGESPHQFLHRFGHQFTECTALEMAVDSEGDVVKDALAPQLHSLYVAPCRELQRSAAGVATDERTDYSRYWHGYRIYIWPLLGNMSLASMRFVNAAVLLGTLIYFFRSFRMAIGKTPAAVLMLVLLSLTDIWRIWRITPHFLPMMVILAGAGWFARVYVKRRDPTGAIVLAAMLGAVFNYLDFLVNPPMMPMLLAFLVLAVESAQVSYVTRTQLLGALRLPGRVALAWFGGYLLTWVAKWCVSVAMSGSGDETMAAIYHQILLRLYGQEVDNRVLIIPLLPTVKMILQSLIAVGTIPFAFVVASIVSHVRRNRDSFDQRRLLALISPAVIPFAWFELLSNHTQTHSHFTYRSAAAAMAMICAAALLALAQCPTLVELLGKARRESPVDTELVPAERVAG